MRFFVGLHIPAHADKVASAFISINRIRDRKSPFPVNDWIMDSGAFTTIDKHGHYPDPPEVYAEQIKRWSINGNLRNGKTKSCGGKTCFYRPKRMKK